ncbi:MAG: lysine transporter LysE [Halobacteriales archaeon SW_8_66_22]|nr:MAG: lysine transporter LysE [Halobacteriales archaeon SW_8_66_22]
MVFGLALAAPPGPMNAIIAEESVVRGWGAGFRAGLGAMLADAVFFVLALIGVVAVVERFPTLRAGMVTAGGVLMLYFAVGAARDAGLLKPGEIDVLSYVPVAGDALAGTMVVATGSPALLAGLFGGIVVWIVGFPGALVAGRRRVDAFAPLVAIGSALVLAGFGVFFLWDGIGSLL